MSMRLPRPTTSTSLWPAVTSTVRRAPSRSSSVLVATVVPCTMRSSLLTSTPSWRIPVRMPSDWLWGVEGVFKTLSAPSLLSNSTRSVNVPPTSTPSQSIEAYLSAPKSGLALLKERAGAFAVVRAVHGAFDDGSNLCVAFLGGAGGQRLQYHLRTRKRQRRVVGHLGGQRVGAL